MTENPLVSIIVPVYKVEAFLDRCVESLLAQSYENIEIILVDDGSPDACPGMCDGWAEKDHRIQVLHKANGGLSDARNQGVKLARGEYVCFVDSDDYVSPDHVEYLLGLLRDYGADIACGSFRPVSGDGESFGSQPEEHVACFDKISSYKALSGRYYMPLVTAWAKLFPADAVRANPFPPGRLHEDEAVTYKLFYESGKTVLGNREIYAYYQNEKSITHTKTRKNMEACLQAYEEQYRYFEAAGCPPLQAAAAKRLLGILVDLADRGDEVCREFLAEKREKQYLISSVGLKAKIRYYGYLLFRVDLNKLYHRIIKK